MKRRSPTAALLALVLLPALACTTIASPEGWAAPVRGGDIVVLQRDSGTLSGLRIEQALVTPLWEYPLSDDDEELDAIYATPIVHEGRVYVAGYSGALIVLDLGSGRPVQLGPTINVEGRIVATPVLDAANDRLFVVTENGEVRALDLDSGALSARLFDLGERVWGGPALAGSRLYVGALDRELVAIDTTSGAVEWARDGAAIAGDLVISDDLLLVSAFDRRLRAFDLSTDGEERWAFGSDTWFWAEPLVDGDTVYAANVGGTVYAIDRASGRANWEVRTPHGEVRAAPALVGGVLVLATREGVLYALDPANGGQLWSRDAEAGRLLANPLVVESGILYVTDSGSLLRVAPASGDVTILARRD